MSISLNTSASGSSHGTDVTVNLTPAGDSLLVAFISLRNFSYDELTITDTEGLEWHTDYEFSNTITSCIAYAKLSTSPSSIDVTFSWASGKAAVVVQEWLNAGAVGYRQRTLGPSGNLTSGSAMITGRPHGYTNLVSVLFDTSNGADGIQNDPAWTFVNGAATGGLSTQKVAVATFTKFANDVSSHTFAWSSGYTQLGETAIVEIIPDPLAVSEMADDFSSLVAGKWLGSSGAAPILANGRVKLTDSAGILNAKYHWLGDGDTVAGKYIFDTSGTIDEFFISLNFTDKSYVGVFAGDYGGGSKELSISRNDDSGYSVATVAPDAHNSVTDLWMRFRRDGNDITFDTSPDGFNWTERSRVENFTAIDEPFIFDAYAGYDTGDTVWLDCINMPPDPVFHNGFRYRKKFTIDSSKLGGGSVNAKRLIIDVTDADLKSVANGGKVENNEFIDVQVEDPYGDMHFHQVEEYNPVTGKLTLWYKASGTNTDVYLYYGKPVHDYMAGGIKLGVGSTDLRFKINHYVSSENTGEVKVTGTSLTTTSGTSLSIGTLGSGIAGDESGTSRTGFIMYSATNVFTRFSAAPPHTQQATNFVFVFYQNSKWYYDRNDSTPVEFTPVSTDILIADASWGTTAGVKYVNPIIGNQRPGKIWDEYDVMVQHFTNNPDGSTGTNEHWDSSGAGNDMSSFGSMNSADLIAAKIGKGIDLDGSNDYLQIASNNSLRVTGGATISLWYYPRSHGARYNIISKAYGGEYELTQETNGNINFYWGTTGANSGSNGATPGYISLNSNAAVNVNQWNHILVTRAAGASVVNFWLNGVKTNTRTNLYANAVASTLNLSVGSGRIASYLPARIDELRIRSYWSPDQTVITEYNNQNSPSTFYSIGAEETLVSSFDKLHTLTDTFAGTTLDTTKWMDLGITGTATVDGQLNLTTSDAAWSAYLASNYVYDFTNSFFAVEIISHDAPPSGEYNYFEFGVDLPEGAYLIWAISDTALEVAYSDGIARNTAAYTTAYSPSEHRWLRIRETLGTVYFETSANGKLWVVRLSIPTYLASTYSNLTRAALWFWKESSGTATTTSIDNLNLPPQSSGNFFQFF